MLNKRLLLSVISLTFVLTACSAEDESRQLTESQAAETAVEVSETSVQDENLHSNEVTLQPEEDYEPLEIEDDEAPLKPAEPVSTVSSGGILPVSIEIPSINVDASVTQVGVEPDGAMEVPADGDLVGWYNRGARPGSQGNAVLAGHVDDRTGPAVFFDLKDVEIGDEIIVRDEKGAVLTFQVTGRGIYPYDDAPVDKVFGRSASRKLNLITCTGEFDRVQGTHRERLVLYTELIEETQA